MVGRFAGTRPRLRLQEGAGWGGGGGRAGGVKHRATTNAKTTQRAVIGGIGASGKR
jgi:hypothetical protein